MKSAVLVLLFVVTLQLNAQQLENLGPNINTESRESLPVISPDGKTLYFMREMPPTRDGQEVDKDIWYSTLQPDGTWGPAQDIGAPLNTWDWNAILSILPDGNTVLLDYVYADDGATRNGFSISHRTSNGWSQPEELVVKDYENRNKYNNAFLCNDGKTMLLALEAGDSRGDLDLYVSFLEDDGEFSAPMNLGDDLNTPESDGTPFLAADGVTLYFSSPGHGGYGADDILVSKRLDDSWQHWSKPVNLGEPINSPDFDAYYTLPASGDYAYLVSSNNSLGSEDIFRIRISDSIKPKPVVLVSGMAFDAATKKPIDAKIRYEILPGGKEAGVALATAREGYKVVLSSGNRYGVRAEADGYYAINDNLDLSSLTKYEEQHHDLFLAPITVGTTIRLNNIFFETGKWDLRPESFPELDRVVQLLSGNPSLRIAVAGHTDNVGGDGANLTLSQNRARAVVDYVTAHGIAADRLTSVGFGKTRPIAPNNTDEGRQTNRRVEFTIVAK